MNSTLNICRCPGPDPGLDFDTQVTRFFLLVFHCIFIGMISVAAMEFWSYMVRTNLALRPERRTSLFQGMGY